MKLGGGKVAPHPLPHSGFAQSVFSEHAVQQLRQSQALISTRVQEVCTQLGARLQRVENEAALKRQYLDFFVHLVDVMIPAEQQDRFGHLTAQHMGAGSHDGSDRVEFLKRLRAFVEAPVPEDFRRRKPGGAAVARGGSSQKTQAMLRELLFGAPTTQLRSSL